MDTFKIGTTTLENSLAMFGKPVDFISIDAEGMDVEVLKSGGLERAMHRPALIMVEHNDNSHKALDLCDEYLNGLRYERDQCVVVVEPLR